MIINNCLSILSELSEIEKTIHEWERFLDEQNIQIEKEELLKTLLKNMSTKASASFQ